MMFKIPAWEDDVPKSDVKFMQKVKKKENTTKEISTKISGEVITKTPKVKNVKETNNNTTKAPSNTTRKRKHEKTNNINKKKMKETPETQNFDEILLNAKKKKFNEVIENEDKEDLLFSEKKEEKKKANSKTNIKVNKSPADKKPMNQNKKSNIEIIENIEPVIENLQPIDTKKTRLKSLLDNKSNRSHINISKTGNKLRDRMLERLKAAQFRYLNEKLYTSSGSEAKDLFQNDPAAFETYHQGYQLQVKKWPVNPLDVIVKKIMKMPKSHTIADMGCGEAALSRRVPHKVRSFDLVATAPGVEACDMARTPLLSASVDATVYCLALMGTDLTQYLVEANRVLKMGGHLLIAEVESRFDKVEDFVKEVERLGFKLKQLDKSNNVFFFMEFSKIREPPVKKAKLPALTLKPCLYKKR